MLALAVAGAMLVALKPPADAAAVAVRDGYQLAQVKTGINRPHAIRFAPDGRLFLLGQTGTVSIARGANFTTALTINPDVIREPGGSAGLLSIAFAPTFATDAVKHVYLVYTHEAMPGFDYPHNVLSRFVINGDIIAPASEEILVHFDSLIGNDGNVKTMHYGGDIEFGSDGKLYVSTGDLLIGPNAQNLQNLYGKILRYNANGSIPSDNPYYNSLSGRLRAIWAHGLRNPFKLTVDESTGDMLIGDVGSSTWEEVDVLPEGTPGLNFGWSTTDGYTTDPRFVSPLLAYPHNPDLAGANEPYGCAVMGGDVYRPDNQAFPPSYLGDYFFADHCQGWLRSIDPQTGNVGPVLVRGLELPVDMAVAPDGSLFIIQRQLNGQNNGVLYQLEYEGPTQLAPSISNDPDNLTIASGMSATFEVFASGTAPLSYQWFKNGQPITGATESSFTLTNGQLADNGATFFVRVSNTIDSIDSDSAVLTVLDEDPPQAAITAPDAAFRFAGGDGIDIKGSAVDTEDGTLPASAFEWDVELHHNTHSHPELGPLTGTKTFSYDVPTLFETDPDIFLRINLRVTDSSGIVTEVSHDVQPKTTTLSFATLPAGRSLVLDGSPVATPLTLEAVVGLDRTLGAPTTTVNGVAMRLDSWENGRTKVARSFRAPTGSQTYRAFYRVDGGVVGAGTGLLGEYFAETDFTNLRTVDVDRVPYFNWGRARPASGVPRNNFSARWSGEIQAQFSEAFTIAVPQNFKDTLTVSVAGETIVSMGQGATMNSGTISLAAGQSVPISIDYIHAKGAASVPLTWRSESTPRSAIPGSQLTPATP